MHTQIKKEVYMIELDQIKQELNNIDLKINELGQYL